jgi:hypothetical protein
LEQFVGLLHDRGVVLADEEPTLVRTAWFVQRGDDWVPWTWE